jgi:type IV pilus assembly protein PilM
MQLRTASFESLLPSLLKDPPPAYAFELSEAGIAVATVTSAPQFKFETFEPGVVSASPVRDNIQHPELLKARIQSIAPANGTRKRRAALILPDYCARVAVLDFDAFPPAQEEQLALVRFRMKKSVPFDVDSAMVSYYAQAGEAGRQIEVLVAVMACEIIARYEAPFRQAGFQPGFVTTSALAALNLIKPEKVTIFAKLSGRTLTVIVLDASRVKLARCVEMEAGGPEEIESILHPTFAYIEDEMQAKASRLLLCGFGPETGGLTHRWQSEWGVAIEALRSRFGTPGDSNAGLLGYLEAAEG